MSYLVEKKKLRIVLADDNPKWLQLLVSIVEAKFKVVGTAANGYAALRSIFHLKPDVAVLDLQMPGRNGLEVTRELMNNVQKPAVVICSMHRGEEIVEAAREAGALGYVFKHDCAQHLLAALEAAGEGRLSFPPGCAAQARPTRGSNGRIFCGIPN